MSTATELVLTYLTRITPCTVYLICHIQSAIRREASVQVAVMCECNEHDAPPAAEPSNCGNGRGPTSSKVSEDAMILYLFVSKVVWHAR